MTASPVDNPDTLSPVRVKIERDLYLFSQDPMNKIKSNYAVRSIAKRKAITEGFDDVVMMNELKAITSSSVGNIIIKGKGIYKTPRLADGVVDGIRRSVLMREIRIQEESISSEDLMQCDVAWIVNSLGIRQISGIEGREKPIESLI